MRAWKLRLLTLTVMLAAALPALGPAAAETPSPAGATAYIINLKDGDTVTSPFKVQFGLTGAPIPSDPKHVHFGGGQTEAMVTLPPGRHTLQLVLGDANHVPHVPPVMSTPITITVK